MVVYYHTPSPLAHDLNHYCFFVFCLFTCFLFHSPLPQGRGGGRGLFLHTATQHYPPPQLRPPQHPPLVPNVYVGGPGGELGRRLRYFIFFQKANTGQCTVWGGRILFLFGLRSKKDGGGRHIYHLREKKKDLNEKGEKY
eukprot:Hpha_TRINITY_DN15876_c0_g10::TRINITY_DN15876_c0_g10_i1::g.190969::m.190969